MRREDFRRGGAISTTCAEKIISRLDLADGSNELLGARISRWLSIRLAKEYPIASKPVFLVPQLGSLRWQVGHSRHPLNALIDASVVPGTKNKACLVVCWRGGHSTYLH